MKHRGIDIANFYVQLSCDLPGYEISNLKLNKLCYYAQGWSLVKLGHPLFDDDIQAWKYGPVIPEVYHTYKVCGEYPISEPREKVDEGIFSVDELNLLIDVFNTYAQYEPGKLVSMTHQSGGPWSQVYVEGENKIISQESIRKYFSKSNELESMKLNITSENVVSYE